MKRVLLSQNNTVRTPLAWLSSALVTKSQRLRYSATPLRSSVLSLHFLTGVISIFVRDHVEGCQYATPLCRRLPVDHGCVLCPFYSTFDLFLVAHLPGHFLGCWPKRQRMARVRVRERPSLDRLLSRLTEFCMEMEGIVPRNTEAETPRVCTLMYMRDPVDCRQLFFGLESHLLRIALRTSRTECMRQPETGADPFQESRCPRASAHQLIDRLDEEKRVVLRHFVDFLQ